MKQVILLAAAFLMTITTYAQISTPAASPFQKIEQKVGLSDVTLEYSRPSMRGRTVFGGLVPYNKVWRTGANSRTKITFSEDVTVGGKELKAGTYAIFTKPMASSWDVYFYTEYAGGGAPSELDETKVAATITAQVMAMPMNIETFTMTFDDLKGDGATLGILWENAYVGISIKVDTESTVMANIDSAMSGPSANDYYAAAVYYLENGKDINKAKTWIDNAVGMNANAFWMQRQQSLIYAKAGDTKGAIKAAKASMALAEKAGNADYVKMNKDSIAEWQK
jgi:hypothetical protein